MSKSWKPTKPTVELEQRPSRIRRDPVPLGDSRPDAAKKVYWDPGEWESWAVVTGVAAFALALFVVWIGFSEITS